MQIPRPLGTLLVVSGEDRQSAVLFGDTSISGNSIPLGSLDFQLDVNHPPQNDMQAAKACRAALHVSIRISLFAHQHAHLCSSLAVLQALCMFRQYTWANISSGLALVLQLTIWFVDSYIENCFATALLGFVYGPMYVAGLALVKELLPADLHMISMQIG